MKIPSESSFSKRMIASARVKSTFQKYSGYRSMSGLTGAQAAKRILNQANMLKEQSNKMNTMNFELVELLVAAIESRDMESGQHIKRIKYFTKALTDVVVKECPEYNISAIQAEYIFLASSVHDIGKIGIPDTIINKPGKLTDEEFAIIKQHPVIGSEILKSIESMPEVSVGARWHHERYDGKGYPDGLKGEAIPEIARIICVADSYDAMTSNRSYRKYLAQDVVREQIVQGRGTQFDRVVADKMLEIIDNDKDYKYHE